MLASRHLPRLRYTFAKKILVACSARKLSSFFEPDPTLFKVKEKDIATGAPVQDSQLRQDVKTMGSLLGKIIKERNGEETFENVEKIRHLAKMWRESGAGRGDDAEKERAKNILKELSSFVQTFSNEELFCVSRAFTHFLAVANAAEGHHRSRLIRNDNPVHENDIHALSHKVDSCGGLFPELVKTHDKEVIYDHLVSQQVELVLTAHPTEVNRRTNLDKQRRVQNILTQADNYRAVGRTTPFMEHELNESLEREISSIWQSDEVAREKPTPQDEAARGTLVVETVLWKAVPSFLRKLNATMEAHLGKGFPLDRAPIKFASWMGGDRDGNSFVTPNVTREVCLMNRMKAAKLFHDDLVRLKGELSITNCSEEIRSIAGEGVREPYRAVLDKMMKKLESTQSWAKQRLENLRRNGNIPNGDSISTDGIYLDQDDLTDQLMLLHKSLCSTGNETIANGFLTDIIRNVSAFGLTLVPLDVRQESDRHTEAIDCITRHLGLGSYGEWDEVTKISWLLQQLGSKRPLIRPGSWDDNTEIFTPTAIDTLGIFQMIAENHEGSLGAYVISQATSASDVLAVYLLQKDAGVKKYLRVAPLFETLDDLHGASATMETLFSLPIYKGIISSRQEIMIGYSDSAKDAGRLAASWAQYETQEKLAEVAKKYQIELTFFHGKGGTVGRGGNPATFKAILAHAPDTINGRFRVTEQGEMITQNFGYGDRAERTMNIYTAAVLAEKLTERLRPSEDWRSMMNKISEISCDAYRKVVKHDERFVPYFRSATPEVELSNLNIGSRPAKRKASGGVESLRAIPWNFAWTQTRLNLPTWLGVGEGIGAILDGEEAEKLHEMYRDWDSFRTTIDLVEMVLAKSEPSIANHYDRILVTDQKAKELGEEIRAQHIATEKAVLNLTNHTLLTDGKCTLSRALKVRNPYVDCLNVLQAETLKRIRNLDKNNEEDAVLKDALLTTITGIANGMGNTG